MEGCGRDWKKKKKGKTYVTDNVGIAGGNTERGGWVDARIHACYCGVPGISVLGTRQERRRDGDGCIPTKYFFAGGSGRSPSWKLEAYFSFKETRFSCTWEDMV